MHQDPTPTTDDLDEDAALSDDLVAEVIDLEAQKRLWVRALVPLLQLRSRDSDPSGRVQLALDMMHIAACERICRVLRGDLSDEPR
jgi:hypothetical protein